MTFTLAERLLDVLNTLTGALDFVDERRTTRFETWTETERRAYTQICQLIVKYGKCPHKKTVCMNEEGNAGVFCTNCGEKIENGC